MKKHLLFFLFSFGLAISAFSQICDGSLGENIFPDGDFGSGEASILLTNPQIAPGYGYATTPPPFDGNYTITNNTTGWGNFAENWLNIGDNSDDPNGYMMVVNASYEPGLFYRREVEGLCENTLYVFSADVHNLIAEGSTKPNVSFLLDGEVVFETGDVPTNQIWNTYGFSFTTGADQTSVVLALQNNAPGGSGNDLALDNISFRPCGPRARILPEEVSNICEGDGTPIDLIAEISGQQFDNPSIQWQESLDQGQTWNDLPGETNLTYPFFNLTGGYYYYRFFVGDGITNLNSPFCRIVSDVKIVYVAPKFYTIVDTLCENLSFSLGENFFNQTGIYTDSLLTSFGCDSIVTLDLTMVNDSNIQGQLTGTDPGCVGEDNGTILIDTLINGAEPYRIFINDILQIEQDQFDLAGGEFNYHIEDRYDCHFDTTINLIVPEPFIVDIGEDLFIDLGDSIEVEAFFSEPADSLIWETNETILCELECETLAFTPENSLDIMLTARTERVGCISDDKLSINVRDIRKIYIPNAFSPNNDGVNDYFTIFGESPNVQQINNFSVYTRWGELVYQATNFQVNDISNSWDGIFRGKFLPDGVYVYVAEVLFLDGEIGIYNGDVSLVK